MSQPNHSHPAFRSGPPRVSQSNAQFVVVNGLVVLGILAVVFVASYPLVALGLLVGLFLPRVGRAIAARWRRLRPDPDGSATPPTPRDHRAN